MFYEHREQTPREWMRRVKQSLTYISPDFDCRRMVHEYMTELYEPAHSGHLRMRAADYSLSARKSPVECARPRGLGSCALCRGGARPGGSLISGKPVPCARPSTSRVSTPTMFAWRS